MAGDRADVPTTAAMVGRFALVYAALALLVGVVFWALDRWLGEAPGGGAMGALVPMLAAMTTAQLYVTRVGEAPDPGTIWRWTALFWLVTMAVSCILAALAYAGGALDGQIAELRAAPSGLAIFGAALAATVGVLFLLIRVGIGMGLRQGMRAAGRR